MSLLKQLMGQHAPERNRLFDFVHIGIPADVATLNPTPRSGPPPTDGGILIGRLLTDGSPFILNMLDLHTANLTSGTVGLALGRKGSGKTNLMYAMAAQVSGLRNHITGQRMRVGVEDTRRNYDTNRILVPEYKNLVEDLLGGRHVNLLGSQINILDYRLQLGPEQQFQLLRALLEVVKGQELTPGERATLNVGNGIMRTGFERHASLRMLQTLMSRMDKYDYKAYQDDSALRVVNLIQDPKEKEAMRERTQRDLNFDDDTLKSSASVVSQLIDILISGYDGIFGNENQIYDLLTQPVVGLDMTALSSETIPLLEMVLFAIRTGDGAHKFGLDFNIQDENIQRWESPIYAANMLNYIRKGRSTSQILMRTLHQVNDNDSISDPGQKSKANTAISHTDVVFIGKTARAQHEQLERTFRPIPQPYKDALPTLMPGQFLVLIGESWHPFLVQVELPRRVALAAYTDHARDLRQGWRGEAEEVAEVVS